MHDEQAMRSIHGAITLNDLKWLRPSIFMTRTVTFLRPVILARYVRDFYRMYVAYVRFYRASAYWRAILI